jgi:hypothetical protein
MLYKTISILINIKFHKILLTFYWHLVMNKKLPKQEDIPAMNCIENIIIKIIF